MCQINSAAAATRNMAIPAAIILVRRRIGRPDIGWSVAKIFTVRHIAERRAQPRRASGARLEPKCPPGAGRREWLEACMFESLINKAPHWTAESQPHKPPSDGKNCPHIVPADHQN